jgi:alpha-tubulin suppressor-like RCC1 family protein
VTGAEASAPLDLATGEAGAAIDGQGAVKVTGIAAGGSHACAVVNSQVRCWGNNESGQLGDGTTLDAFAPVPVVGLPAGVTAVRTGIYRTCAIVENGARCWGTDGECGELAARALTPRRQVAPVTVTGLESGVTDIAIGLKHTCAVVNGGALCWGNNERSQVGDQGSKGQCMRSPVQVPGLASGVTAIVAGNAHTCALVNGGVRCWGSNEEGQLGDNSTTERTVPVQVVGLETGVTALSAGYASTCAVVNGAARCWGDNAEGELGDGTRTDSLVPVQVLTLTSNVSAIAAGSHFACAVVGGAPRCWGLDPYGSMYVFECNLQPVSIYWVEAGVRSIAAGFFTCAIVGEGVKCWGGGHLGDGAPTNRGLPVDVVFP